MQISVVVPVYNSEGSLPLLVERLASVLKPGTELGELILVNDGSEDRSWDTIQSLSAQHSWIRGFNLMRNYGQHNSLLCGIRRARFPVIVTMDDDLQNPPEEIPAMLAKLEEGHDVVYGTPQHHAQGLWRNAGSWVTRLALQSAMGAKTARNASAFRTFRTHLRAAFADYSGPYVSIDVLLTWGTKKFSTVAVKNDPRAMGASNYSLRRLIAYGIDVVTGFSTVPLQLASIIGFAFTTFGFGMLVYVLVGYFRDGDSVPGFPFLASIVSLFSGAQLFALGIIGEYLARMHFRAMARPCYRVVSDTETNDGGTCRLATSDPNILNCDASAPARVDPD